MNKLKRPRRKTDAAKPLNGIGAGELNGLIAQLEERAQFFIGAEGIGFNLTGRDRQRLFGAGVKGNGFIDKTFDIARDNPEFMPPNFDMPAFTADIGKFEGLRQLTLVLRQFQKAADDAFIQQSDRCYREALRVYGSLREQARARVPGAEPLFEALMTFFRRRRKQNAAPTGHELENDFKKLLHGKAGGKIEIVNEAPKLSAGVHKVVDAVNKGRAVIEGKAEA